jgi:2-polyprenyl-3-methyl-5-hydroxy-6-metoxy-1,4-benzoquinol methylase
MEGTLDTIDFSGARFGVVRLNHVLEHVPEPLQTLGRIRRLLHPEGVLFVSVPNLRGLSPRLKSLQSRLYLKRNRWRHYAALHHLWFFNPGSLRKLLEKSQFEVVFWETPVLRKAGQSTVTECSLRFALEPLRLGSIIDSYSRLRTDLDRVSPTLR